MRWYRVRQRELKFVNDVCKSALDVRVESCEFALDVRVESVWVVEGKDDYGSDVWETAVYCRGDRDHAERVLRAIIAEHGGEDWDKHEPWSLRDPDELLLGEDYATMDLD